MVWIRQYEGAIETEKRKTQDFARKEGFKPPKQKHPILSYQVFCFCTVEREYFQHLEAFLRLIEPMIQDLRVKGFIK